MPSLTLWSWLFWLAAVAGQLGVACLLVHTGLWKRFRAVFLFVCWRSAISFSLLLITLYLHEPARSWWYFYVYYFGAIVGCVLQFAIIVNLAKTLVSSDQMRNAIETGLRYMGGAYVLGFALLSIFSPVPGDEEIVRCCVALTRATSMAWLAVFLCVAYLVRWLRLTWPRDSLGMAVGYALCSIGEAVRCLMGTFHMHLLSDTQALCYLACLATWAFTLRSAAPSRLGLVVTNLASAQG